MELAKTKKAQKPLLANKSLYYAKNANLIRYNAIY